MEGHTYWGTTNLKVATAVAAFGAKPRPVDPVTRVIKDGHQQVTFWFISDGNGDVAKKEMEMSKIALIVVLQTHSMLSLLSRHPYLS